MSKDLSKRLMSCVTDLIKADEKVAKAEKALTEAKKKAQTLREETIPGMMEELGITRLDHRSGRVVTVKQEVYASIPADNKEAAHRWLEEHDHGDLIKVDVTAKYGKGDIKKAIKLWEQLEKKGLNVAFKESVHASTLKAFLREQLAAGKKVPLNLFGARPVLTTVIK